MNQSHNRIKRRRTYTSLIRLFIFAIMLSGLFVNVAIVRAEGAIDYDITLSPTVVETGDLITYEFSSSCSGVIGGCVNFEIEIDYDETVFEYVGDSIDSADGDATITDDGNVFTITDPTYGDGDGFTAVVTLRVRRDLTTGTANIPSTITTSSGDPNNTVNGTTSLPTITVENPDLRYDVRKTQVLPSGLNPAFNDGGNGAFVQYNVQYCATQDTDVLPISDAILVDQLPPGVNLLTPPTDPPDSTSGTVATGQFLIWNIGDMDGSSGCITRTVAYEFPTTSGYDADSDGSTTPSTTNTVSGYFNDDTSSLGTCPATCIGQTTESPELDDPSGQPNVFKSIRDDRPVAFPGNNEFSIGFNTADLNVDMTNVTIGDTLPTGVDVYEISPGTWSGSVSATLNVIFDSGPTDVFTVDGTGGTITYGTAQTDGSAVVSGAGITPVTTGATRVVTGTNNRINRVELVFATIPQAFSMSGLDLLYTVDTDVISTETTQQNCAIASYSGTNPTPTSTPQGCQNTTLTNDPSSVVNFSKSSSTNSADNSDLVDDYIDFTITLEVDQQSSNSLTGDLSYTDSLPDVLDFVRQDESAFAPGAGANLFISSANNLTGGDSVPTPFIRVTDSTADTLEFIWTTDLNTLTFPVYNINGTEYNSVPDMTADGQVANPISIAPPATGTKDIIVTYKARVKDVSEGAFAGDYTNNVTVDAGVIDLYCDGASVQTQTCDTDDSFEIVSVAAFEAAKWVRSNVLPVINVRADRTSYDHNAPQFTVNSNFFCTTPIGTDEVLRNDTEPLPPDPLSDPAQTDNNDPGDGVLYSRTPCVAQGNPGESFEYLIEIVNRGNNQLNEFVFYDILPFIGDTGVNEAVATTQRFSEFEVWLDGAISIDTSGAASIDAADFDIQYSASTDPCRPEMSSGAGINDWQGCGTFVEDSAASSMTRNPRSFRIVQTDNTALLSPDETLVISVPVYIPTETDLVNAGLAPNTTNEDIYAETGEIAWNSFAFRFRSSSTGDLLLTASPRKVGIRIPERLSVGNRVWIDDGRATTGNIVADIDDLERDDTAPADEQGVANVVLELYRFEGTGGTVPANSAGNSPADLVASGDVVLVSRTATDADGHYLFEIDMRSTSASDGGLTVNGNTFGAVPNDTDTPDTNDNYPDDEAYDWIGGTDTRSLRPGSYFIYIPPENFNSNGPLFGYASSNGINSSGGNGAADNRDRGNDTGFSGTTNDPVTNGVVSEWFDLEFYTNASLSGAPAGSNSNPLNETDMDTEITIDSVDYGPFGRGNLFQKDEFSDLVRDFGFIPLLSIGNFIWIDDGSTAAGTDLTLRDNGVFNNAANPAATLGTEVGVNGVDVELYIETPTGYELLDTTTTANNGYYIFDNIPPGNYYVQIPASEFSLGGDNQLGGGDDGPLAGYRSSSDGGVTPVDADPDYNDHGIDNPDPANTLLPFTGISSPIIELLPSTEPVAGDDEAVTDTNDNTDPAIEDSYSDLTVDFGFVPYMSIGNIVWHDNGSTAAGFDPRQFDDGIRNGNEPAFADVTVELYYFNELTSAFVLQETTVTDANGFYLFDDLPPGTYYTKIPNTEFISGSGTESLVGYFSSTDVTAPADGDADNDDHGIDNSDPDNADPAIGGVRSPDIVLTFGSEPTTGDAEGTAGTVDSAYLSDTADPAELDVVIDDGNSDLTVDFGFVRPMSIGNRVWFDMERSATATLGDGTRQLTEVGVPDVLIQLYADTNNNGVFDIATDTLIAEDRTTDTGTGSQDGYYLFDRMTEFNDRLIGPGNYFVHIPFGEFATTRPLFNYVNSNNGGASSSGGDTQTDSIVDGGDENGVDAIVTDTNTYPATAGVTSGMITLGQTTTPFYETEPIQTPGAEADFDPALGVGFNGQDVSDNNGDLTVDFGFYQGVAIGNRVWFDSNRSGRVETTGADPDVNATNPIGSIGIPGVTLHLYRDDDGDEQPDGGATNFIATAVTDNEGFYIFDQTSSGDVLLPGRYIVGIPSEDNTIPTLGDNSTSLQDMINTVTRADTNGVPRQTAPGSDQDNDDNGIDLRDVATIPTIYYSEAMLVTHFQEPELEDPKAATNPDGFGISDINSNLTVDFGFFIPMAIGNRVWFDSNRDAEIDPADRNPENLTSTSPGIDGVIVELFRDAGSGINLATDTPYRVTVTTTDTNTGELGYYLFDDLPEGNYIVRLAPENFQAGADVDLSAFGIATPVPRGSLRNAAGPYSSTESGLPTPPEYLLDNGTESNDNGIDENLPQNNGIFSTTITLLRNSEPFTGSTTPQEDDTDLDTTVLYDGVQNEGRFGEEDYNTDLTIDFGVYAPLMSIGNRVFKDYDNNRIFDGVDEGVENVIVNLFRDDDNDGNPDSGITNPIATTLTDATGYYLFDGLNAGDYLVQIDEDNFRTITNGVLQDFYSSQDKANPTDTTQTLPVEGIDDIIENGVDDPFNPANNPDPQANGVFSPTIFLEPSNEISTETLGPQGDGEPNIQPTNSDLTVDFGFYQPMSIGNVVWFDTIPNGLIDASEAGIANVEVYLYRDDGDGIFNSALDTVVPVFDGTNYVNFDTTDANGYYLFDNLLAGQYFVHIPSTNFTGGALTGYNSTTVRDEPSSNPPAPTSDNNHNGEINTDGSTAGITSELVTLGVQSPLNTSVYIPGDDEPALEFDKSLNPALPANEYDGPASIGRYGEIDANSDITVDFGFVLSTNASMSIGNRVWFDTNRDGLVDAADDNPNATGDPGINDVVVLLYRSDAAGNPIGAPIARDITTSDSGGNAGYYLFDVLDTDAATAVGDGDSLGGPITPGNYVVVIPDSNFAGGGALENHITTVQNVDNLPDDPTTDSTAPTTPFVDIFDDDNNDNGREVAALGIISDVIQLVLSEERSDEGLGEPVGSKHLEDLDGTDAGGSAISFDNSDLTIDFGFYIPMSIGNFVWVDTNNNGVYDSVTENPVDDGVTLSLYESDGTTPVEDPANPGNPYQVTTDDGYYLFENLPPGDYVVTIDPANFQGGGILEGYVGSDDAPNGFEDNTDDDDNDNGRDAGTADPLVDGIPSGVITLSYGDEPTGETTSGNSADGPNGRGNNGELDNNSNLTVDFGVYPSEYFSIGNRVWEDDGAGTNRNNGIMDSDESGIGNVIMYLFRDEDSDDLPDTTLPIATTTTNGDGYYLFDSLPPGNYIVSVAPENFEASGTLRSYDPAQPADPSDSGPDDDEDNTTDQANTTLDLDFGYYSGRYTLEIPEPISPTEVDVTPANAVQDPGTDPAGDPIPDNQSNLTVDFGFVRTLTIGNLIWFDLDADGVYDNGTELGISNVEVRLYEDDGSGDFDINLDSLVATDITDGNGFYLFNNVSATDFFIHVPYINWNDGGTNGPLFGYESTTDASAGDRGDNNDNGIGDSDPDPTDGITSELFTMSFGGAPTGESVLSNNDNDGPEFRGVNNPPDNNSDLTRDFGFVIGNPMSIGNIVWLDDGGPTGGGTANDGIRDGDEEGIDGVIVELYSDSDGDGIPDTTTPLDSTTTNNGGYYLFDGLPPGDYVVVIAADNFDNGGVLNGFRSTSTQAPDTDDNDNGDDTTDPVTDGVRSDTVELVIGNEPTDPTPADPTNGDDEDSEDVTGTGSNGELDEDSNLTVDFGFVQSFDWGDAPDTYGTNGPLDTISGTTDDSDEPGASHRIIANLYLGAGVDDEGNGQPVAVADPKTSNNTSDPDGDGTDEDGMDFPNFVAGTTVTVDVTAFNRTGETATLIGWFDWNGDGTFDDTEAYSVSVPNGTDGIVQLDVDIPIDAEDQTGGSTYVRLRYTTDSITASEPFGPKDSGEVEDYLIQVDDPGLLINKTDGLNSIIAGETNTYTITIENSGEERIGVRFFDDLQIATDADPNGYDPETIEWTCVGTNGGLCISNPASGTDGTTASDGPFDEDATSVVIDELIDLPRDGVVTYTITARVNPQAGLDGTNTLLINVAQLPNEDPIIEDDDETAVIYDPPFGVKTGTLLEDDIIRWTMIWYNPGAEQTGVVIRDTLNDDQTFPPTTAEINLQCSGSVGTCAIVGDDTVEWQGTMQTSTEDDDDEAVIISFNVLVDGDGTYRNTGTLEFPTDVTATASARVRIQDGEEEDDDDDDEPGTAGSDDPGFTLPPPPLIKVVDTPFTLPGAEVVWTITAINNTDNTAKNVVITDTVPSTLTIVDVQTSAGDLQIDGQNVTVKLDSLFENETVTITVTTTVNDDVEIPFAINNPAVLTCDCSDEANAIATILSVLELPATGETPLWRDLLIVGLLSGLTLTSGYIVYRRKISLS